MNGLAGALAVLAVVMRVLFPGGYMLADTDGSGRLAIVICTGEGMKTVVVDQDGRTDSREGPAPPHSIHDGGLCPYAGAAAPGVAPDQPVVFAALGESASDLARPAGPGSARIDRAGALPPPTGPPAAA